MLHSYDQQFKHLEDANCDLQIPRPTLSPETFILRSGLWINLHYSNYWYAGLVIPDAAPPLPASNLETLKNLGKSMLSRIVKK